MLTIFGIGVNIVKHKDVNRNSYDYLTDIKFRLDNLLSSYGADRVALYKFSEFDKNQIGLIKYKKLNCYVESVTSGGNPMCYMHQNIPTILLSNNFKYFKNSNTLFIKGKKDNKGPSIKYMMHMLGSQSAYNILIKDDDLVVGLITMQFTNEADEIKNLDIFYEIANSVKIILLKNTKK